jgi:hypothetical protein
MSRLFVRVLFLNNNYFRINSESEKTIQMLYFMTAEEVLIGSLVVICF